MGRTWPGRLGCIMGNIEFSARFGNVSSGYREHEKNFVWVCMCAEACFYKLFMEV